MNALFVHKCESYMTTTEPADFSTKPHWSEPQSSVRNIYSPVMLQSNRNVGASPEYWLIIPLLAACGTGIVNVMGLWNLRRLGSTVTIGETATRLPSSLATKSAGMGWAWKHDNATIIYLVKHRVKSRHWKLLRHRAEYRADLDEELEQKFGDTV